MFNPTQSEEPRKIDPKDLAFTMAAFGLDESKAEEFVRSLREELRPKEEFKLDDPENSGPQ